MSLFKPVMVGTKTNLDTVELIEGQYIIVLDKSELYVDKRKNGALIREKANQNIYCQNSEPIEAKNGDFWFEIESTT